LKRTKIRRKKYTIQYIKKIEYLLHICGVYYSLWTFIVIFVFRCV